MAETEPKPKDNNSVAEGPAVLANVPKKGFWLIGNAVFSFLRKPSAAMPILSLCAVMLTCMISDNCVRDEMDRVQEYDICSIFGDPQKWSIFFSGELPSGSDTNETELHSADECWKMLSSGSVKWEKAAEFFAETADGNGAAAERRGAFLGKAFALSLSGEVNDLKTAETAVRYAGAIPYDPKVKDLENFDTVPFLRGCILARIAKAERSEERFEESLKAVTEKRIPEEDIDYAVCAAAVLSRIYRLREEMTEVNERAGDFDLLSRAFYYGKRNAVEKADPVCRDAACFAYYLYRGEYRKAVKYRKRIGKNAKNFDDLLNEMGLLIPGAKGEE